MGFYDKLEEESTKKVTLNGSPTFSSSLNKNLDLFALGGASRKWDSLAIEELFGEAFREDPETALRNLVHLRNIRQGGLGERRVFRESLKYLSSVNATSILAGLVSYIPYLGRWDDVVYLFSVTKDENLKRKIASMIKEQLRHDLDSRGESKQISLLAKWLPSVNTSSKETRRVARELIKYMFDGYSPHKEKLYRKMLSLLRDYLNVVEVRMTAKEYNKIDFSQVPSLASIRYRNAFYRNDPERYSKYLDKLESGKTKVNASVVYPYQIVQAYDVTNIDVLLENAWKSLPDYIGDSNERAIVVADTSGSMLGTPMNVAISLAIYCAQRLKGEFHGKYISFSAKPTLNTVYDDETLCESIRRVYKTDWGLNTDINKVFSLILDTAIKHNMTQDELPNKIIIISD